MDISSDIKNIQDRLLRMRFENELNDNQFEGLVNDENERTQQLKIILNYVEKNNTESSEDKLKTHLDKITIQAYMKKWSSLDNIQKKNKLNEYVKSFEKQYNLQKVIDNLYYSNNLNSSTVVKYDKQLMKITNITLIEYDESENKFKIIKKKKN